VDAILVMNCPTALAAPAEAARAVVDLLAAAPEPAWHRHSLFTAWLGEHSAAAARRLFNAARLPTYATPEEAVAGFLHRVRYQKNQTILMETPPARPDDFAPDGAAAHTAIAVARAAGRGWVDAQEGGAELGGSRTPRPR